MNKSAYKRIEKDIYIPKTSEILICLCDQPQWLNLLYKMEKPYEKLLPILYDLGITENSTYSIKSVSVQANERYDKTIRWIKLIYNDLFYLNRNKPELFKNSGNRYELFFSSGNYKSCSFTLWLDKNFNRNDYFNFYFIKAKINNYLFWVEQVNHEYVNGELSSYIYLSPDKPNLYFELIRDQAYFYNLISIFDRFQMTDDQLKQELIKIFPRYHHPSGHY